MKKRPLPLDRRTFLKAAASAAITAGSHLTGLAKIPAFADKEIAPMSHPNSPKLIDFNQNLDISRLRTRGPATFTLREDHAGKHLQVTFGPASNACLWLLSPDTPWNLHDRVTVELQITNLGDAPVALIGRLNDKDWVDGFAVLQPGETDALGIILKRTRRFPGMNGLPGGHVWLWEEADPEAVETISLQPVDASGPSVIAIRDVRAVGEYLPPPEEGVPPDLLPLVDPYGQYLHSDWPDKIHSDEDLSQQRARERDDLLSNPGPNDWNAYGGWDAGPRLQATGRFRVEKYEGKWWLVDPEGGLYWSHGPNCVNLSEVTRVAGRENYFQELDDRFRRRSGYDFGAHNLARKYGDSWSDNAAELAHLRLHSWGMNSIANWSASPIYGMRKTPYFVAVHYSDPTSELGAFPYQNWEAFRQTLRRRLAQEERTTAVDPWCIGYFVDNELRWPRGDCSELAENYYRICREEVKRIAPDTLYLGSRLHDHINPYGAREEIARAAARHCDVVSVNRYRFTPSDLRLPEGFDKPLIIGEFHWGALDRGLLHPGLRSVANQRQRAAAYRHYLSQAALHPHLVGAHWFQYRDQLVTGRFDGENYQIGFLDICDTPQWEIVAASRDIGRRLYPLRAGK